MRNKKQDSEVIKIQVEDAENLNVNKSRKTKKRLSPFEKKKKRKQNIIRTFAALAWTIGACLFFLCCSNLYQQMFNPDGYTGFFGIGEAVVVSNSMEPKINVDDLIFYKKTDVEELKKNDIVVYKKTNENGNPVLVVHRIINIGSGYVTTKGDQNAIADESVSTDAIVGKYLFKIGAIGALFDLFYTLWAPLIVAALFTIVFIVRIIFYFTKRKKVLNSITRSNDTKIAIEHFFEI